MAILCVYNGNYNIFPWYKIGQPKTFDPTTGKLEFTDSDISVINFKANIKKNGYTEIFDLSYKPTENPKCSAYKELKDSNGNTYYLAMTNEDTCTFKSDGLFPTSGGFYNEVSTEGTLYNRLTYAYAVRIANLSYTVKNENCPEDLLNEALYNLNTAIDELNIIKSDTSSNIIYYDSFDTDWLGLCTHTGTTFNIKLNTKILSQHYGEYVNAKTSTPWLSTLVHELGHTLGFPDNAGHEPTLYSYSRNRYKAIYLQPNDICLLREWEQMPAVPDSTPLSISSGLLGITELTMYNFDYDIESNIKNAKLVLNCKLKFKECREIDVCNNPDREFFMNYAIYTIEDYQIIKGELHNNEIKICMDDPLYIDENKRHTLYLQEYETTPSCILNKDDFRI